MQQGNTRAMSSCQDAPLAQNDVSLAGRFSLKAASSSDEGPVFLERNNTRVPRGMHSGRSSAVAHIVPMKQLNSIACVASDYLLPAAQGH